MLKLKIVISEKILIVLHSNVLDIIGMMVEFVFLRRILSWIGKSRFITKTFWEQGKWRSFWDKL